MIFKYNLGNPNWAHHYFILTTPKMKICKVLDIQLQNNVVVLWAEVEPVEKDNEYIIWNFWTGENFPNIKNLQYISTIQEPNTVLVYHYYIELNK